MRYVTRLSVASFAAAASLAFAATASATTGTDSSGGSPIEVNDTIHATNVGNAVLDGTINITCSKSTIGGTVTNAGSASTTIGGNISTLTFEECGSNTVTVVQKGTLEGHTGGIATSSGAEVTSLTHNILGTVHCIYVTSATNVGKGDGSNKTGGKGTITIDSLPIPRKSTDFGCGSTSEATGEYTVTTPAYVQLD